MFVICRYLKRKFSERLRERFLKNIRNDVQRVFHSSERKTSEMVFWFVRKVFSDILVWLASQIFVYRKDVFGLSDKHLWKGYCFNGLNEVYLKRRFEQTCWSRMVFWKNFSTSFLRVSQWYLIWMFKKNVSTALITFLEEQMRYSLKGKDVRRICYLHQKFLVRGLSILVKEKVWIFYLASCKFTLCHAVCQHEIGRKGVLLPTHHAATLALASTKHSKTFQRLLSCGKK